MEAKKIGNISLEITRGDIASCDDDIIVNAANTGLWMGAGVAGAIKAAGGIEIEKEALAKAPITAGSAVFTKAGKLKARYVIHAAVMGRNLKTSAALIRAATMNALLLGDGMKMGSIAFPALGTGVGRFPVGKCAEIMTDTAVGFDAAAPRHIKRVKFVLFSELAYGEFHKRYLEIK